MNPQPAHKSTQIPDSIAQDPRKMRAALLIAEGARLDQGWEEIAREAGVTRRALFEWRKDPGFQQAVLILARESIRDSLPMAFKCLGDMLKSGDTRSKLKAAELILRVGGELVERVESTTTLNATNPDAKSILDDLIKEIEAMEHGQGGNMAETLPGLLG
jgi:hypothetical protein